tara:strand:- start:357 stop:467 length:111 start_codon:yes stop_codon:yes gene_type:complete
MYGTNEYYGDEDEIEIEKQRIKEAREEYELDHLGEE